MLQLWIMACRTKRNFYQARRVRSIQEHPSTPLCLAHSRIFLACSFFRGHLHSLQLYCCRGPVRRLRSHSSESHSSPLPSTNPFHLPPTGRPSSHKPCKKPCLYRILSLLPIYLPRTQRQTFSPMPFLRKIIWPHHPRGCSRHPLSLPISLLVAPFSQSFLYCPGH